MIKKIIGICGAFFLSSLMIYNVYAEDTINDVNSGIVVRETTKKNELNAKNSNKKAESSTIEDGIYMLESGNSSNLVLDISNYSMDNGGNAQIYQKRNSNNQRFLATYRGNGYYTFQAIHSGKYLDVKGGSAALRTNAQQWGYNGSKAQLWKVIPDGKGYYYLKSKIGTYLDNDNAVAENNNNVILYKYNGTNAQKWKLISSPVGSDEAIASTVYFDENYGELSMSSKEVIWGNIYGSLPEPTRMGYSFAGWYTGSDGGNLVTSNTVVTASNDHVLYASWKLCSYTVNFDANGGNNSTDSKTVTYASTYGFLPTPTRTGYEFIGWYTSSNGGENITSSTKVSIGDDQTLYAKWEAKTIEVSFDGNGGECNGNNTKVSYGSSYGTLPIPQKQGYEFAGWYTSSNNGVEISSNTIVSTYKDQTLYAHWEAKKYEISFVTNGGNYLENRKITYGKKYGTLPTPIRTGYAFVGWYTDSNGGELVSSQTILENEKDQILYARWDPEKKSIVFDGNGGEVDRDVQIVQGSNYGSLPRAVYSQNIFLGWYTQQSDGQKIANSSQFPDTHTQVLYAHWKLKTVENIKVISKTCTSNAITWDKVEGATGYMLYRKYGNKGSWSLIASHIENGSASYTDTNDGFVLNGKYYYKIKAIGSDGVLDSDFSKETSVVIKLTTPKLKTDNRKPMLEWSTQNKITGIVVYRAVGNGSKKVYKYLSSSVTKYVIDTKNLKKGTDYNFYIRTYRKLNGKTIWSNYSNKYIVTYSK